MKNRLDSWMIWYSVGCVIVPVVSVILLIGFILFRGMGSLDIQMFFGDTHWLDALSGKRPVFDGIWPAMAGTVYLVLLASAGAVIPGIFTGMYLAEFASHTTRNRIGTLVDILAGTPSILMGLFGFTLILFLRKTFLPEARTCLLLSAFCIGLLILPYIIRATQTSLEAIPFPVRIVGTVCGFSRWQNIRWILMPVAAKSMFSGLVLAIGRASEDTAVIMLTGAVAQAGLPKSLWDKYQALPFHIFYTAAEYQSVEQLNTGFGAALVLLILTGSLFGVSAFLKRVVEKS